MFLKLVAYSLWHLRVRLKTSKTQVLLAATKMNTDKSHASHALMAPQRFFWA